MKKNIIFYTLTSFILMSCGSSTEKKVEKLIKEEIQSTLYYPESYDPVETTIDSAFSPLDNSIYMNHFIMLTEIGRELKNLEYKANISKSDMALWGNSGYYYTDFERAHYQEAEKEYDNVLVQEKMLHNKAEEILSEMQEIVDKGVFFIGYKANHRYRSKTNSGNIIISDMVILLNKDITEVVATYDADLYNSMQDAIEIISNYQ